MNDENKEVDWLGSYSYDFVRTMALVTLRDMAFDDDLKGYEYKEQSKGIFRLLKVNAKHFTEDNEEYKGEKYDC